MGVETKITCDQCGEDHTTTGNCVDYRLALESERVASWGGAVTAMAKYPPVDRKYIFCGLYCLAAWMKDKMPGFLANYDRHMKHKKWLAEQTTMRTTPSGS